MEEGVTNATLAGEVGDSGRSLSLEKALGWIADLNPARAVLTNMHVDLDYRTLQGELPDGVEPGYDGMEIPFSA